VLGDQSEMLRVDVAGLRHLDGQLDLADSIGQFVLLLVHPRQH
jgi:hypothetical protein